MADIELISTHTPLAGCDLRGEYPAGNHYGDFNSHTPRGVRPSCCPSSASNMLFQLTHPSRGATTALGLMDEISDISTHTPLAGCDQRILR